MAEKLNLELAISKQLGRELVDMRYRERSGFLAMLAAMDAAWGVRMRHRTDRKLDGHKHTIELRTGLPTTAGANAITGSLSSLELPPQKAFSVAQGEMTPSYYQGREDMRRAEVKVMESSAPTTVVPYVKKIAKAISDSIFETVENDLFPDNNLTPSRASGGSTGAPTESKVMAAFYPFQCGRDGNDPAGTTPTTYEYCGINLNATDRVKLRAIQAGTSSTAFGVMSPSNFRSLLRIPLKHRNVQPDLLIVDSSVYNYLITEAEKSVVIDNKLRLEFGGESVVWCGVNVYPEYGLDRAMASAGNVREGVLLDTSKLFFAWDELEGSFSINSNDKTLLLQHYLYALKTLYATEDPGAAAHAFNISLT